MGTATLRTRDLLVWALVALAMFVVDLCMPLGIAGGMAHVVSVLVAARSRSTRLIVSAGCMGVLFTMLGYWCSSYGPAAWWQVVANRGLSVAAVAATTAFSVRQIRLEELSRLAVEAAPNAIVLIASDGRIVLVNRKVEEWFQYDRTELLGTPIEILVPERFRDGHPEHRFAYFEAPSSRAMAGADRKLFGRRKDGSEFPVEIGLNPITTSSGVLVLSAIVDITERRRAEERFRIAIEAAPNAMVAMNRAGRIVLVNRQTEELFGYDREEILGKEVEILVPERFRRNHPRYRNEFFRDPHARPMGAERELFGRRKDGTEFPVEIGLNPIEAAGETLVLSAIVDITERHGVAEQFERYTAALEQRNRELDEFAYVASHDLKAPLRAIDNLVKWIAEDASDVLPAESRRHLATLRERVERMERLLEDLLEFSRAGRARTAKEVVNVGELVNAAVELLAPPETIAIEVEGELPCLMAERVPLEQVFRNLIGNAVKHHDRPDGCISISAREREEFWEFEVMDDGPGIAPEFHQRIFQMFQTLKPRDEVEGSGMGLAVVKKLVESWGGRVSVRSRPGEGSSFSFTWPKVAKEESALCLTEP